MFAVPAVATAQVQPESAVRRYSPDLIRDKYLVFIDKYYYMTTVLAAAAIFSIAT